MKTKITFVVLMLFFSTIISAQIVNIPDANFKNALVNYNPVIDVNGDSEIQYTEAEVISELSLSFLEINDLTGIEAFENIEILDVQFNSLTTLDLSNNSNLINLNCLKNDIVSIDLTNNLALVDLNLRYNNLINTDLTNNIELEFLNLSYNSLASIDLTNNLGLVNIHLGENNLTSIDLTNNLDLVNIVFYDNNLISIDVTNNLALEYLNVRGNDLTSIDITNNLALYNLSLSGNDLTSIDVTNNLALEYLDLFSNNIANIDLTNNLALESLYLGYNSLTSIDVTNNLDLVEILLYENNITSIDVTNNLVIELLSISGNDLTSIDISQNVNLKRLRVSHINNIDLSNNTNLLSFRLENSGLSNLDLSSNNNLCQLLLFNNFELNSVNIQNGNNSALIFGNVCNNSQSGIFADFNNPVLYFICVDDALFAIDNFTNVPPLTSFIEDCAIASSDINRVQGIIKYDNENDGCDGGDALLEDILVNTTDGTNNFVSVSNELGFYNLNVVENTYTTTILGLPTYFTVTPNEEVDTFVGFNQIEVADFCITPNTTANDLTLSLAPTNDARPGFDANYQLVYENVGTTQLNGTIVLEFDETRVSFNESIPTPTSQTSNTITWNFGSTNPFETGPISVEFNLATPPTNESGDILNYTATIYPIAGDETPNDNVFQLNQEVVNSQDPNNKVVLEGSQVLIENADDYLHYIIRFQNLGTASAINVRVQDELDELLDWTSLKVLESSHDMEVQIINKKIDFIFNDINLPTETSDPEGSQGFIVFKIKPVPGIILGDTVENNARIYFDFNSAIITNLVSTTFVDELSVGDFNKISIVLYPNPVSETLHISFSENIVFQTVRVYSILGEKIVETSGQHIDFSNFTSGIYFVEVATSQGMITKKVVKN